MRFTIYDLRFTMGLALALFTSHFSLLTSAPAAVPIHTIEATDTIRRGWDKINSNFVASAWQLWASNYVTTNGLAATDKVIILPAPGTTNGARLISVSELATNLGPWITNAAGGGSATNAIGTVKSNGVNIATGATSLDFVTGSNTLVLATNIAGAVTVQINANAGGGGGEANLIGDAGSTNATLIGTAHSKSGLTLLTRSVSAGYGAALTNQGTNVAMAVDAAVIASHAQLNTASNVIRYASVATNELNDGNRLYVRTNGNDSTAIRGRMDKPYLTLLAAKTAALPEDTVVVGSGTYTSGITNLFKDRVHWEFHGPTLDYMDVPTNTSGCGLFDDRFSGAVTSRITGSIWIKWCSGTNVFVDPGECTLGYNTNALGPIVVTNANTLIIWDAPTKVEVAGVNSVSAYSLYVKNCQTGTVFRTFTSSQLFAPATQITITTNCAADPSTQYSSDLYSSFCYWEKGTFDLGFDTAVHRQYGLEAYSVTNTDADQIRIHGNYLDGKIYGVGRSKDWKIWADILELKRTDAINRNAIEVYYAGSHYFRFQKISGASGTSSGVINMAYPAGNAESNLTVWVDIDKMSYSNGAVRVTHGQLRGRIGHFEQNGPNDGTTAAITVTNNSASVSLSGENIYAANTVLLHGGGATELHGYNIISTNRDPILVTGSGLSLDIASAQTISGTNSIRAATAQTVTVDRGYLGPAPHANVALAGTNNAGHTRITGSLSSDSTNTIAALAENGAPSTNSTLLVLNRGNAALEEVAIGNLPFGSGSGGPSTNAPPQTLTLGGTGSTNIIIDMLALGPTNEVRFTLTTRAAYVFTNIVDGKYITAEAIEDSTGGWTMSTNNAYPHNIRIGTTTTGFDVETNANWRNLHRFRGSGTNAQLVGYSLGFPP